MFSLSIKSNDYTETFIKHFTGRKLNRILNLDRIIFSFLDLILEKAVYKLDIPRLQEL